MSETLAEYRTYHPSTPLVAKLRVDGDNAGVGTRRDGNVEDNWIRRLEFNTFRVVHFQLISISFNQCLVKMCISNRSLKM